jgi:neutral ceramidase
VVGIPLTVGIFCEVMRILILPLVAVLAATAWAQPVLKAGVARVEITPSSSMPMYGYANRKCGPSNGVHDPLFAKALVLEAGDTRLAIVTMDIGSMVSEKLRQEVADKLHIPTLLLSASHTHSGPAFLPYGATARDDATAKAFLAELERKIFGAVQQAAGSLAPARLAVGRGSIQLGYNRLLPRDDGRSRALFDNLERVPYGPVDPEFVLLRVDSADGTPRALLVHYATHAVVLGSTNCRYSADYPGVMQRRVEQELNGAQVMFVQGGAGDINPLFMARSGVEEQDFKVVDQLGELLAGEVLRANRAVKPIEPAAPSIQSRSEVLTFADRWEKGRTVEVGISTILINGQIAIAATTGEVMNRLQRMWKEQAEVPYPLFYAYTWSAGGAWPGYIPDLKAAAHGGYGADSSTRIEVGAGEKILLRHLTNLYGLLGMWHGEEGKP